jgi:alpha-tubulin suppressor-like RCC1 family protein
VYHTILSSREIPAKIEMPSVQGVEASFYHAIFYCKDPFAVYGTGSNRFGQLGTPETPEAHQPIPIAFFDGLAPAQFQVSCGTFQTSFVLDGDLYTCGLGTHHSQPNEDDGQGYLNLAEFRNDEGKECEVNVVKAVCGGKHIIAIDGRCFRKSKGI